MQVLPIVLGVVVAATAAWLLILLASKRRRRVANLYRTLEFLARAAAQMRCTQTCEGPFPLLEGATLKLIVTPRERVEARQAVHLYGDAGKQELVNALQRSRTIKYPVTISHEPEEAPK